MTLLDRVTGWLDVQQAKHGLDENYKQDYVNNWTNYELLQHISEALEEMENAQ